MIANIFVPLDKPISRFCFASTNGSNHNEWIGAAIGAAASIGSALLSHSDANKANHSNANLNQVNRDWQEKMLQKQLDYNTEMWNKENEYNTASAQRKRLEDAGLNPYLMMNGGSAGSASSTAGVSQAGASPIPRQSFDWSSSMGSMASSVGSLASDLSTASKSVAETQGIRIENQYKVKDIVSRLNARLAETRNTEAKNVYLKLINDTFKTGFDNEQALKQSQTGYNLVMQEVQRNAMALQTAQKAYTEQLTNKVIAENKWIDQEHLQAINESASRILLNKSGSFRNYAEAKKCAAEAVEAYARANNINIDSQIKSAISGSIVSIYWNDANIKEARAFNMDNYGVEEAPESMDYNLNGEFGLRSDGTASIPGFGSISAGQSIKFSGGIKGHGYKQRSKDNKPPFWLRRR